MSMSDEVRISGYPRFAPDAELLVDAHNGPERWTGADWNEHVEAAERNANMVTVRLIEAEADHLHQETTP